MQTAIQKSIETIKKLEQRGQTLRAQLDAIDE